MVCRTVPTAAFGTRSWNIGEADQLRAWIPGSAGARTTIQPSRRNSVAKPLWSVSSKS
jgi:hypothetical protein